MKSICYLICILFFTNQQEIKIKGKYEMQYEQKFKSQNCVVDFGSKTYKRKLADGKIVKGSVKYSDNIVLLTDEGTFLQMEFYQDELQKDTIYFKTKDLKVEEDKNKKTGIVIYSGKLIKLK